MINLIELITHFHEEEVLDFPDNLEEASKNRILQLILQKQANYSEIPADSQVESTLGNCIPVSSKRKPLRKKLLFVIFAAVLLFSMAVFASSDGQWDIRLMEFWHLTDTTYLEGGNVLINKSSTSNHMTLTACLLSAIKIMYLFYWKLTIFTMNRETIFPRKAIIVFSLALNRFLYQTKTDCLPMAGVLSWNLIWIVGNYIFF